MALIPKPPFPNIPKLPGVPQLLRSPNFPAGPPPIVGAAVALGRLFQALFAQPQWAIYKHQKPSTGVAEKGVLPEVVVVAKRTPVVKPDSFIDFGYRNEYSISDYPVQDGGFASYDKVANPYETFVRMSKGGSKKDRQKFLDELDAIVGTLELYDILTPEKTYLGVNVLRYEISRRGNKSAYFFNEVDLYFREIREVTSTYSNTSAATENARDPSAKPVDNTGTTQPQPTAVTPEAADIPTGEVQ
jgi:hypothetical protein